MTFTTYDSHELLDVEPGSTADAPESVARMASMLQQVGGVMSPLMAARNAIWSRQFTYWCHTVAERSALYDFLDRRSGRYLPCWVPTYSDDLTLVATGSGASATFRDPGPERSAWGVGSFRHACAMDLSSTTLTPFAPGGFLNNGDGTLSITTWPGPDLATFTAHHGRVCWLKWARLDSDTVTLDHSNPGIVIATLKFVELPGEVPW